MSVCLKVLFLCVCLVVFQLMYIWSFDYVRLWLELGVFFHEIMGFAKCLYKTYAKFVYKWAALLFCLTVMLLAFTCVYLKVSG